MRGSPGPGPARRGLRLRVVPCPALLRCLQPPLAPSRPAPNPLPLSQGSVPSPGSLSKQAPSPQTAPDLFVSSEEGLAAARPRDPASALLREQHTAPAEGSLLAQGVQQPSGEEEGKAISSLCQGLERRLKQANAQVSCTTPPARTRAFPHAPVRIQLSLCHTALLLWKWERHSYQRVNSMTLPLLAAQLMDFVSLIASFGH